MPFRNVIIREICKLEYSLNYLVCRKKDEEKRILLDEISLIIITSTQVSITTSLISMLSKKKIKIIFCDETHNPECEIVSYYNNFYSYRKIKEQINFVSNSSQVWKLIIKEKIKNQAKNLYYMNLKEDAEHLMIFYDEVTDNDLSNREGHSAKVYFNSLFGSTFSRRDDNIINKYLNYGYSILLSCINREIKMLGYLTELGIHHIGESNQFNFSCDLIEPLRPFIDSYVLRGIVTEENFKIKFIEILTENVIYNNQNIVLENAIHLYVQNIISCLKNNEMENIKFIEYEL